MCGVSSTVYKQKHGEIVFKVGVQVMHARITRQYKSLARSIDPGALQPGAERFFSAVSAISHQITCTACFKSIELLIL
jgi:hypothetical protein